MANPIFGNITPDIYQAYTDPRWNRMPSGTTDIDADLKYDPVTGQYSVNGLGSLGVTDKDRGRYMIFALLGAGVLLYAMNRG